MLNYQIIKIMNLFLKHEKLYLDSLSKSLNIQRRSVFLLIDKLNFILEKSGFNLINFHDKTISLKFDNEKFQIILNNFKYIYSPHERRAYLLYKIIEQNSIDFQEYEKIFQVSKSLYEKDLFVVKQYLRKNNINLITIHKSEFNLKINQLKKREIIIEIINMYLDTKLIQIIFKLNKNIQSIIVKIQDELGNHFSEKYLQFLKIYFNSLEILWKNKQFIEVEKIDLEFLINSNEYLFSTKILKDEFDITDESEIAYFAILLLSGNNSFKIKEKSKLFDLIKKTIFEFLFEVERKDLFIFNSKKNLVNEVLIHFIPSYFRMKYGIKLQWDFFEIIEKKYEFYFKKLSDTSKIIENLLEIKFNQRELTLLLIYFILNLTPKNQLEKYDCAIIIDNGMSVGKIQKNEIEHNFNNINITDLGSYKDIMVNKTKFYIIFANQSYEGQNIVTINKFIKKNDIDKINYYLKKIMINNLIHSDNLNNILTIQHVNIFEGNHTWQQAIQKASNSLIENRFFNQDYVNSMIENVVKYGPYTILKKGLSIPHSSFKKGVNRVGISISIFKDPIIFNKDDANQNVDILIVFCSHDNVSHIEALVKLIDKIKDDKDMAIITKLKTKQEIYNYIFKNKEK